MSRPRKMLVSLIAVFLICSLGAIVSSMRSRQATESLQEKTQDTSGTGGTANSGSTPAPTPEGAWAGLKRAGIPVPGEWSRPQASVFNVRDGKARESGTTSRMPSNTGAIDAALSTMDALLDPNSDDRTWAERVKASMGKDAAGVEYPFSGVPRYWLLSRRFTPDKVCGAGTVTHLGFDCDADNSTFRGSSQQAIGRQGWFSPGDTRFAIPADFRYDSKEDPQNTLARHYDTVVIPMDDGPWQITVYCPANPYTLTDMEGNETDVPAMRTGTVLGDTGDTGFGTRQHPCHTVEVAVGGQTPYWYVGQQR